MTTLTSTLDAPATTGHPQGRGWVHAGIAASVAAAVGIVGSLNSGAAYEPALAGDAVGITERLAEQIPWILVFHVSTMTSALLMVPFAVGLHRYLRRRTGDESLLPGVAALGLVLVMVAQLMGTALTTEFAFGVQDPELLVPETAVFFGHWIGTVPWVWAGAGVAALAVGLAGRRFGAVARWLTWTSLILGVLMTLLGVSPLQYMAGMLGPIWLLAVSLGLLRRA